MAVRNRKSVDRNVEPTTDDVTALLASAFHETRALLGEMAEILGHPATRYDLFPRVVAALDTVLPAEERAVYRRALSDAALAGPARDGLRRHREIQRLLASLAKVPSKDEQTTDLRWRRGFAALKSEAELLFDDEERRLFPRLAQRLTTTELRGMGADYRQALANGLP
jgi:hypothetical protein